MIGNGCIEISGHHLMPTFDHIVHFATNY